MVHLNTLNVPLFYGHTSKDVVGGGARYLSRWVSKCYCTIDGAGEGGGPKFLKVFNKYPPPHPSKYIMAAPWTSRELLWNIFIV